MPLILKQRSVLPGFGLTLGYTMLYLSIIVIIPLSSLFFHVFQMSWHDFWEVVSDERVIKSFRLTYYTSFIAALTNLVFGFIVAWTLIRYSFPGKKIIDALVDLPFALPTAVSGIVLSTIYMGKSEGNPVGGWIGRFLDPLGIHPVNTPLGVTLALTFIGLPFVVRTLQPAIEEMDAEVEEAAASLGADRVQTFIRIIVPSLLPAMITGFALAFARALGEYGSVIFISGNQRNYTEITASIIVEHLDQGEDSDYPAAIAIAVVMLVSSFLLMFSINLFQYWATRRHRN